MSSEEASAYAQGKAHGKEIAQHHKQGYADATAPADNWKDAKPGVPLGTVIAHAKREAGITSTNKKESKAVHKAKVKSEEKAKAIQEKVQAAKNKATKSEAAASKKP